MNATALGSLESSEQLIRDLYVDLRQKINMWADITKQTAQARMGYIGQHLVSVVTGHQGGRSGARGKDLILPDGQFAEIKTCYRVDQLGECNVCNAAVSSLERECSNCGSDNIKRKDDSKWLIGVQHDEEFANLLTPKFYYLVLFDFVDLNVPDTIRASIWRINPLVPGFAYCLVDYYKNIKSKSRSGAPFNLWPFSLKFELMQPVLIYRSFIRPDNTIRTEIFPDRNPESIHPLSPLQNFARSPNFSIDKIRLFSERIKIKPYKSNKKVEILRHIQCVIEEKSLDLSLVVSALAHALYWVDIKPHLASLPHPLRDQIATAKII